MKKTETTLSDGSPITDDHKDIDPETGMQKGYIVLSKSERAKGFVQPVRTSYKHVGTRPEHPIRDLTAEEKDRYRSSNYVSYEEYPSDSSKVGRFWTERQLNSGCNTITTMTQSLAETYARDPNFYDGTMCTHCKAHFPIGEKGEFVWEGTDIKVGTVRAVADVLECMCCKKEYPADESHNCIASRILTILNREVPLGAAGYMTPAHKAELAKAIHSELFGWNSALLDKVPTTNDGGHLFLLRVADTGETRVLYGDYEDLRRDIELAATVGDRISGYMVIQ